MRLGVILAAGRSKRFKGKRSKVVFPFYGKPLILYPVNYLLRGGVEAVVIVTSPQLDSLIREELERSYPEEFRKGVILIALQEEPLGTAHAFKVGAEVSLKEFGKVEAFVVTNGDVPLIRPRTVAELLKSSDDLRVTASEVPDPSGYGRIFREGNRFKIVEEAHLDDEGKRNNLVNLGLYYISSELLPLIASVKLSPKGEYYLTDLVDLAFQEGFKVSLYLAEDWREFIGINKRSDLALAFKLASQMKVEELWEKGVAVLHPESTFISPDSQIGEDTVIYPNSYIESSFIGENAVIGPNAVIIRSRVADGSVLRNCYLVEAEVGPEAKVGPFAYLRPGAKLRRGAKAGTFVEIKNSVIGENSKVPHLSYVGDAEIGRDVNVGAGTITCNYDGYKKHKTVIEDEAFIGSNTSLVAPVKVGRRAVTGAGSVVTRDIPPEEVWVGNPAKFLKTRAELERKLGGVPR